MKPFRALSNIDLNTYFGNNVTYSRDNLPDIEDKFYIINLDDSQGPGTHWVVVHNVGQECYHFDSFGVAPAKEIIEFMKNCEKQIYFNIYRVQPLNSYMCGYYCIDFINSINKGMTYTDWLLQYNPQRFRRNDEIVKSNLKLK